MYLLVFINIAIITMDVALLSIEYASLLILETTLKGVFYSIKLKLEFAILGRLVKFVSSGQRDSVEDGSFNTGSSSFSPQPTENSNSRSTEREMEGGHTRHFENMSPAHNPGTPHCVSQFNESSGSSETPLKEMSALQKHTSFSSYIKVWGVS